MQAWKKNMYLGHIFGIFETDIIKLIFFNLKGGVPPSPQDPSLNEYNTLTTNYETIWLQDAYYMLWQAHKKPM